MSYGEDSKRKKRLAIIGVSSFLLVAMVVAVTVSIGFNNDGESEDDINGKNHKSKEVSASMKAIKTLCQPTYYKQTCERSLAKSAGNTTDPKELIKIAFKLAEKQIDSASKKSLTLLELEKDPRTRGALNSCKELMTMSINELRSSLEKVADFDFSQLDELMADIKTWLSAAITYEETCLDAFENTTTNAGEKMKKALKTAMEMSSNGLDIVSGISSVLTDLQIPGVSRRLLQDDIPVAGHGDISQAFPAWIDPGTRRLLSAPPSNIKPDLVVAKDGSGDYKTILEALPQIPKKSNETFVLYIKEGIYEEYVEFNRSMTNLVVIGDGPDKTRITGSKNFVDGINTYRTATVAVIGDNFVARNIGFENSAGAIKHQAVALRVSSDYAVFYNCSMDGYQDTLYTHAKRQFYRDCTVSGTIDFVFGDAPVVFQNCTFLVRKPLENQQCIVTAQGRKARRQPSAIIIQNSTITAHPELEPVKDQYKSYLGRPWKEFSRTIIMETFIDDLIQPEGWSPWFGSFGLKTCWYGEYNNYGPGSDMKNRVKWNGIKPVSRQHAIDFTPGRFLRGDSWIKPTGVPYAPYLTRP
ncbi:probable pectinesterase/pectinesterase inhibitor 21 [Ricinus communis]|jgi:pectinesterase|uniref:Pectinesterase n=1 Tax=Ricinus communis TaxID=3988 RepID=B9RFE0_RICCO|nr:probable pectinesterase/pectinesterase inhibitor 21 [Ricinus communis]EEF49911.1 Pectinesterase precursor, putative [Ricinus communis]|eukprot:XP_002512459.1 probable pectinesterase/pectinesterase inhibitor 21 [Ricinus communis]